MRIAPDSNTANGSAAAHRLVIDDRRQSCVGIDPAELDAEVVDLAAVTADQPMRQRRLRQHDRHLAPVRRIDEVGVDHARASPGLR